MMTYKWDYIVKDLTIGRVFYKLMYPEAGDEQCNTTLGLLPEATMEEERYIPGKKDAIQRRRHQE